VGKGRTGQSSNSAEFQSISWLYTARERERDAGPIRNKYHIDSERSYGNASGGTHSRTSAELIVSIV